MALLFGIHLAILNISISFRSAIFAFEPDTYHDITYQITFDTVFKKIANYSHCTGFPDLISHFVSTGNHSVELCTQEVFGLVGDMAVERVVSHFDTVEGKRKWNIK